MLVAYGRMEIQSRYGCWVPRSRFFSRSHLILLRSREKRRGHVVNFMSTAFPGPLPGGMSGKISLCMLLHACLLTCSIFNDSYSWTRKHPLKRTDKKSNRLEYTSLSYADSISNGEAQFSTSNDLVNSTCMTKTMLLPTLGRQQCGALSTSPGQSQDMRNSSPCHIIVF